MKKWADYLITGIWKETKDGSTHISHVLLHEDYEGDNFENGVKTSRQNVIKLLKQKKTIKTVTWSYHQAQWELGANVDYETVKGVDYLRSNKDGTVNDNLNNLIPLVLFDDI